MVLPFEVNRTGDVVTDQPYSLVFQKPFNDVPVFLADMQTADGSDTANLRWDYKDLYRVDVWVAEEQSKDSEMKHTSEAVGYMLFSTESASTGSALFEVGEIEVNDQWQQVTFNGSFVNPVVVATPLSLNGTQPATVRIRNVNASGFEIRIQEWDYLDGSHALETVSYLVMESGNHTLEDGTMIEAGQFQTDAKSYKTVTFGQAFPTKPVVLAAVSSVNESDAVVNRLRNVSTTAFQARLQEQESQKNNHGTETISYIAWEVSSGIVDGIAFEVDQSGDVVTDQMYTNQFQQSLADIPVFLADMQTMDGGDPANLRWQNRDALGVDVQVAEEQSKDSETGHTTEAVGYMLFAPTP